MSKLRTAAWALALTTAGCDSSTEADRPKLEPVAASEIVHPALTAAAPAAAKPAADAAAKPAAAAAKPAAAAALTPEEIALMEADPNTLTPEQRRARSYAFRKKVMQNPDSAAAKALAEARRAFEAGELQVPEHIIKKDGAASSGIVLHQKPEVLEAAKAANPPAGDGAEVANGDAL